MYVHDYLFLVLLQGIGGEQGIPGSDGDTGPPGLTGLTVSYLSLGGICM